jgi:hypothetical protein
VVECTSRSTGCCSMSSERSPDLHIARLSEHPNQNFDLGRPRSLHSAADCGGKKGIQMRCALTCSTTNIEGGSDNELLCCPEQGN